MNTVPDLLNAAVEQNPSKAAIIEERELSYSSLQQRVHFLAGRLRSLGVKRGDAVALLLPNGADFVTSFFATVRLGAVAVPLNSHYQQDELIYFTTNCNASVLITIGEFAGLCGRVLARLERRCDLIIVGEDASWEVGPTDPQSERNLPDGPSPTDNLIYQYSSGSTGLPKRIARTHANLAFELKSLAKTLGLSAEDRFLGLVPFSHVNGLVRSMLACLSVGATLMPLREFKRQMVAHTIRRHRATVFIGVPFMFGILAETNSGNPADFSSLRLCVSASAPMPTSANRKFNEKYGLYIRQLYGSTETGTMTVNMSKNIQDSLESVGLPIAGVSLAVFRDNGARADVNETGEVAVKSPAAIGSYHGVAADRESFRNGHFFTGDLGKIDSRGYLYLLGRKKFFINKGGYKINPSEVESLLGSHPKVKEVVVVGAPTPYGDERVRAVIVPREECSEEEIIEYCRGKIADFKVPSLIEFRDDLPKTPTGKILRTKLQ